MEVNYSMPSWAILCNILEIADVEILNNRANSVDNGPFHSYRTVKLHVPISL
jgi:hypothetical protein